MPQKTEAQVWTGEVDNDELGVVYPDNFYDKVRKMRKHPTIKLVRGLSVAPILASQWNFESDEDVDDEIVDEIRDTYEPMRTHILRTGMYGMTDFGWQPYEKCFEPIDGKYRLKKLKPLLQDITEIRVDRRTGAFKGFLQSAHRDSDLKLDLPNALLFNMDVEGTYWYGEGIMEAVLPFWEKWCEVDKSSDRYQNKIAGAHWVVSYPQGKSMYKGQETNNFEIAQDILNRLESNGKIAIPRKIIKQISELNKGDKEDAWKVEILESKGGGANFLERQAYLDKLFVRCFGFPERSILEGQFGTKAEAGEHGDFALSNIELRHAGLLEQLNWHCVNQQLRLNYGPDFENKVRIVAMPLVDKDRQLYIDIFTKLIENPETFLQIVDNIDIKSLQEKLGIPLGADNFEEDLELPDDDVDDDDDVAIDEPELSLMQRIIRRVRRN